MLFKDIPEDKIKGAEEIQVEQQVGPGADYNREPAMKDAQGAVCKDEILSKY